MSSNRKFVIKKQPAPFQGFKIVKIASPRPGDVELIGKPMTEDETKKFVGSMDRNTIIEIVE